MTKKQAQEHASREAVRGALQSLPEWKKQGAQIKRTFAFGDFAAAMKFVNAVARAAEKANHHPDIDIRWNKVFLALTTHDAGGLTAKDFQLAAQIETISGRHDKASRS